MSTNPADLLRDPARLAALGATQLAGTPPEEAFDRVTRLAVQLLRVPISLLSLVDGERQWVKSAAGLPEGQGAPRSIPLGRSICGTVAATGRPLVIADVEGEPAGGVDAAMRGWGVRAYAGVPLVTREGHAVGVLCVADTRPHPWNDEEVGALRDLAALAATEIEWRRARAERDRTSGALRTAEQFFRPLVEQSLVAIYLIQDGVFRYVNPRFLQVFGLPADWLDTPRGLLELVDPQDHAIVRENVRRRLAGEVESVQYSFRGRRADGELLHLEVHGSRTVLDGRPAVVGVGIDVTERMRAEHEREQAIIARDRFYAMMSHELRTPVSAVMLYNDLLLSGVYDPLSQPQREAVERSQLSARHLLELINDLLDLSRLEAGRLETRVEDVETAELAESVVAALSPLALEHGCHLTVHVAARPLVVLGDARRVRQILLNLLSNAVKFGHGQPVEVRLGPAPGGVLCEVSDHGPGIPPDDLERIFEEFVQVGEPGVGTGLGLPIARRLAELQGGTLEVESRPGEGSTFRLFLPGVPQVAPSTGFPSFRSSVTLR
ncbi:MAG TPA: GAF domain-containing sensor histidine kinase [Longimicrobium sp.]|nr:GAF domain-containing sensor histidine kinase [Longimicrobium sp.]